MTTWSDIRELAGQLKSTQDKSSIYNLSERTWVDIVRYLTTNNRLKLIYTTDGRSYITNEELCKEIREEVEAHAGRISLSELSSNLDVDPLIIEARASELVSTDANSKDSCALISIPGELLNRAYIRSISQDIQDLLEVRGQVTIGYLATTFSLPTTFLTNVLTDNQGTLFRLQQYGEKYFTEKYIAENRARVRGYFTALIRPIVLSTVACKLTIPESLLSNLVSSLINSTQLCGQLIACRGTYVPACYINAEESYINAFYAQNGYVEWSYLKRLGITDPGSYLRSKLPSATHLSGVSLGSAIIAQLKAQIEEVVREASWVDLTLCLPVSLTSKERVAILNPHLNHVPVRLIDDGLYLVSEDMIAKCEPFFSELLLSKAEVACRNEPKLVNASRNVQATVDREASSKRSNTQAKGGFGMGAREIRTKNVKNKYVPGKRKTGGKDQNMNTMESEDFDNAENVFLKYVTEEELVRVLKSKLPSDVPEDVISGIVVTLLPSLERFFSKTMESIFTPNSGIAHRKQSMAKTQDIVNNSLFAIQLIERSILAVDRPSLRVQLLRHLARSHASDLVDSLCHYISQFYEVNWPDDCQDDLATTEQSAPIEPTDAGATIKATSMQQKMKLVELLNRGNLNETVEETKTALQRLVEQLRLIITGAVSELADYYSAVSCLAVDCLGMNITVLRTRPDKRKREERVKANELALQTELQLAAALESLRCSTDVVHAAATAALTAACLFAQVITGWPMVAPGKCVPDLSAWLTERVTVQRSIALAVSPSSAISPAVSALMASTAVEDLEVLTCFVTQNMRTHDALPTDVSPTDEIRRMLDVAKTCRKLLYT